MYESMVTALFPWLSSTGLDQLVSWPDPNGLVGAHVVVGFAALTMAMLAVLATRIVAGRRDTPCAPVRVRALAFFRRAADTAFLPVRDPDAPGRPRPRAPGAVAVAA